MKLLAQALIAAPLTLLATTLVNVPAQANGLTFATKVEVYNAGFATYQYVKLVDKSAQVRDRDGWDVSAIAVEAAPAAAAAPEPTTMAGLALAGAGLTAYRRRFKAAKS